MGILDMTMGCTHSPDTAQSAGTAPYPGSSSQLAFAGQHPFLDGQAFEPDRAAGVQAVGGKADLRAQTVFVAVGEAGGQVDVDRAGIDFALEALGGGKVLGDDGFGVLGAVAGDVIHGSVQGV